MQSLTHIDYANRIPRGARYARNGSVRQLSVSGNKVRAKVAGSRYTPYSEVIVIPTFSEKDIDRFITELLRYPGIIAKLLNRKLDPAVIQIADECGLKIFPRKWDDLGMKCNCPDWAVPCKHLAAVIYMLSREIDNNPFLVFLMHGVDLIAELNRRGVSLQSTASEVDSIDTFTATTDIAKDAPAPTFHRINLTRLSARTDAMLMLLPDNPPFSATGNFKEAYATELRRTVKNANRYIGGKLQSDRLFAETGATASITTTSNVALTLNGNMQWQVSVNGNLVLALLQINPDFLPDYEPSVIAAQQALLLALHLLSKGCVAPQITKLQNGSYRIFWRPALIDAEVKSMMQSLDSLVPMDMLRIIPTGKKRAKPLKDKTEWLVTYFLDQLVSALSGVTDKSMLHDMFFKGVPTAFSGIGEREQPGGIKAWIDHLQLTATDFRPVFSVNETAKGFKLDIGVEDLRQPESTITALSEILANDTYADIRFSVLSGFAMLSAMMSEVDKYINSGAVYPIRYTQETFTPFLFNIIPAVQLLGIKVFLPKALGSLLRPKTTVSLSAKGKDERSAFGLFDLFKFEWKVAIGNQVFSREEFEQMQLKADSLIRFKQSYIYVSADDLRRLHESFSHSDALTPEKMFQAALTGEYMSAPVTLTPEVQKMIEELTRQDAIPLPTGLNATLRPYQERGFAWMYRNMRLGFGSILADDMGLGKTLQSITLMLKLKEEGTLTGKHILVVAPTGLLTNWAAELQRFAPQLSVFTYHGGTRDAKDFNHNVMLTSYGVVRSDAAKLKKTAWRVVLIDEAQNIKNRTTAQSKAVNSIPADAHIALSGTPVENRLSEFWSIMDFTNKGYLGTPKDFNEHYAKPIQMSGDEACALRFRKLTAPFIMRRMKTDKSIISDLPDKIELDDYATLKGDQAVLYQRTLDEAMKTIEGLDTADHEALFKRQGLILQMILALKQICNHPAQYLKNGDCRMELSGKAEMLVDRVEGIVEAGEKVLVFTQFTEMGDMLVNFIEERTGQRPMFLHGGCSIKQREEMVNSFQTDKSKRVFVLSLKAAGTGLNLTAANHVIHYDLWWNPAVEAQATDRAYRIGQKSNVMVHRFITRGTFEERINDMIQQKRHLADMTVASGESWIGKLSNKELREIFG